MCQWREYPWRPEESDPLESELKAAKSHLMWVLSTELRSFGRTVTAI